MQIDPPASQGSFQLDGCTPGTSETVSLGDIELAEILPTADSLIRREEGGTGNSSVYPCDCQRVYSAAHATVSGSVKTGDLTLTPSL